MADKISLIVQPGDSFFPLVRVIDKARTSVNITIFRLDDPIVLKALVEASQRGVAVRALIATSANGWEEKNRTLLKKAKRAGIETREPRGDSKKTRFHYKFLTVDGELSQVLTFNPTRENLHYARDFGIESYDATVAAELTRLFDADWSGADFTPDRDSRLLISPYNSRAKMLALLEGATRAIHVADAKLQDKAVVDLLRSKSASGVRVRVLCDQGSVATRRDDIEYRPIGRFKLHAKCVIVDSSRAVLGSMNLRAPSLDKRREVGILVDNATILKRLEAVFASDWTQVAQPSGAATTVHQRHGARRGGAPSTVESAFALIARADDVSRYALPEGDTTIGRADDNEIVVPNSRVSRYHARIRIAGRRCVVADMDSANGTFVNGVRVEGTQTLAPGDVIGVGGAEEFRFVQV